MKSLKVNMVRRDEVEVELDPNYFNEEWFKQFRKYMYDYHTLQGIAEYIAFNVVNNNATEIDGIGVPLRDGERPYWINDDVEVNEHVNVNYNSYNTDTEYE
ncbi:hypothetical protein [Enterococcus alishanensis]